MHITYLRYGTKFSYDLAIALNNLLLDIEPELPPCLGSVVDTSLIKNVERVSHIQIGV